ncbi:MAG: AAA family ATPase [Ignavibacteriota bacterium]|jgi:ATP-dependent Lon protease|nr:MAG: ATP-binding protein [Chlorobiota bacterium]MBE7476400.1 AAA family ATPase [Ignavibacteriales bacterium]MBL1124383.1 ATP-binding protein [Ignavibacteriota bacterium]MBV6420708.1 Lon protease [Ignavibacteriaceae bacterium]MCE7857666.1 ATP-binding protein [Ignavibacteria bacterium CHB3]MEB2295491.1 AAA family ATPase [Ignavibacteria bacterium]
MTYPKSQKHKELSLEDLRWKCNPDLLEFDSTQDLKPIEGILGQERALKAMRLGVEMRAPGYNIFICGMSGSGKATTVKQVLETIGADCPPLFDYAYVNNFKDPDRPILLKFSKGKAKVFKRNLFHAIEILKRKIPQALESEDYLERKKKIVSDYSEREQELMHDFDEKMRKVGFSLGQVKVGEIARPDLMPIIKDKLVPVFQLNEQIEQGNITKEEAQELVKKYNDHQQELQILFKKGLKTSEEFQEKLQALERGSIVNVVKGIIDNLQEKYNDSKVVEYLDQIEKNILENVQIFKGAKPVGDRTEEGFIIDYFKEYNVNIILDNTDTNECPIIVETSPTYSNLFGAVERISDGRGSFYSDFTNIKAGSLLRANGGYMVLNVTHLFEEPGVWKTLKRVLTYNKLEFQDSPTIFQLSTSTLKPEPIEIDLKVILIGSQYIYSLLSSYEYDFKKMFKIKADFDYEIKRSDKVLTEYARVIKKLIKEEKLKEFDRTAIAYLLELGAVFAGQKNKLTTRFSKIADLAREANFWAVDDGFDIVTAEHIKKAYKNAVNRHGMLEAKISEMYENGTFLMDTTGERIGQINGLAVYEADFYSFGRPTRITATVSLGSGNIINVEREAGMSGRHYNKGVLIISGYFKETFGQDIPLAFNVNLVFEQSYGTVDGDSASCAEIYALLSTLSGIPIKQGIAVTGSLNQKGDVQPIGGVNEKIEGFFEVCKYNGLNGKQGVVIPIQNVKELMLKEEVIDAVNKKQFHIYAISRIEEGIEILTGVIAGKRTAKGYEKDSVFDLVEKKLKEMYKKSRNIKDAPSKSTRKKRRK